MTQETQQLPAQDQPSADATPTALPEINFDRSRPVPVGYLRLGERRIPLRSILDVPVSDLDPVMAEDARLRTATPNWTDQVALAKKQILLVAPDLTEADLDTLTSREIAELAGRVFLAGLPPAEG